jgi:hypothetical protein
MPPIFGWVDSTFNIYFLNWLKCMARDLLVWADLLRHIWGRSRGQTRKPPPFGFVLLQYINLTYGLFAIVSNGANPYPNDLTSVQVWHGPSHLADPPNYIFFQFSSRTIIEHLPPATWQPLIGPPGGLSLGHVVPYQFTTPRRCATSMHGLYELHMARSDWSTD